MSLSDGMIVKTGNFQKQNNMSYQNGKDLKRYFFLSELNPYSSQIVTYKDDNIFIDKKSEFVYDGDNKLHGIFRPCSTYEQQLGTNNHQRNCYNFQYLTTGAVFSNIDDFDLYEVKIEINNEYHGLSQSPK
jgi:hypothetical protein